MWKCPIMYTPNCPKKSDDGGNRLQQLFTLMQFAEMAIMLFFLSILFCKHNHLMPAQSCCKWIILCCTRENWYDHFSWSIILSHFIWPWMSCLQWRSISCIAQGLFIMCIRIVFKWSQSLGNTYLTKGAIQSTLLASTSALHQPKSCHKALLHYSQGRQAILV